MQTSVPARVYTRAISTFLRPGPEPSLRNMIAWFRRMNVKNPQPMLTPGCRLIPYPGLDVPAWLLTPQGPTREPLLVYLHGGGFVGGPHLLHWPMLARMARKSHVKALMLRYPLAPEHPYPAAFDVLFSSLLQLQEDQPIILAGDSVGAALALSLALRLRNEHQPLPLALVLLSPVLDLSLQHAEWPQDVMLQRKGVLLTNRAYAGEADMRQPYLSPLYGTFERLPPTLVLIGNNDLFYPDAHLLFEKAREAQWPLQYEEFEGIFHEWMMFPGMPETSAGHARIAAFVEDVCRRHEHVVM